MNKPLHKDHFIIVLLAVVLAVGMTACGSSKKNTKTAQPTVVENVKEQTSPKNNDKTPPKVADALVSEARTWLGVPYRYGGHSHEGADCSGFLMEVFKNAINVTIPRSTKDQREACQEVDRDELSVGDILFFSSNNSGGKIAHVGMYVGDGRMIHASSSRGVVEDNLDLNYYVKHFRSIGRVPELAKANPVTHKPAPKPLEKVIDEPKPMPVEPMPIDTIRTETLQIAQTDSVPASDTPATIVKNAFNRRR